MTADRSSRYALPVAFTALLVLMAVVIAAAIAHMGSVEERVEDTVAARRDADRALEQLLEAWRRYAMDAAGGPVAPEGSASIQALDRRLAQVRGLRLPETDAEPVAAAVAAITRARQAAVDSKYQILKGNVDFRRAEEQLLKAVSAGRASLDLALDRGRVATRQAMLLVGALGLVVLVLGGWVAIRVTRRVSATEEALQRETELAQVTLHSIGDGVITADRDGYVEYLNPEAERHTGWRTEEAKGRPIPEVFRIVDERSGRPLDPLAAAPDVAEDDTEAAVSVRLVDRNGRECPIRYSHAPIRDRGARTLGLIIVFHDISQIRAMAQQLLWQASHDALTGLVNRREFERRLSDLITTAKGQQKEHALMFMDLDNFKAVNDTCGHNAGDELLRQLTTVMTGRLRGSDTLARLGGDEFGALLESCPLDHALRIANAVRETVREFRFVWQDKTFSVGVSIGLVPVTAASGTLASVLADADATCYEAKKRGRDCVQVHRPTDSDTSERHVELQIVSEINSAFEHGRFRLLRQRIVPVAPGGASDEPHFEVLVRMIDSHGNVLAPTAFIPAAERYNLLTSLERWVISSLIAHLHELCESGVLSRQPRSGGYYSVNLSGASINDRSFPDFVRNLLTRYRLPAGLLCFEITESIAISNLKRAADLMHGLKALGCRFSLDDFGTGMSSFAYLKHLPVDILKIAGTFVTDVANDPMDCAIVEAVNRIGHILGMETVAESVEDAATMARIAEIGIDYAQGYYLAVPEPLTGEAVLEERSIVNA